MSGPDMGALSKKVGPLPAGVWIAIVAGGLGVSYYINRNQGGDTPTVPPPGGGYSGVGNPSGGWVGNGPSTGGGIGTPTAPIATNEAWMVAATNAVKADGTFKALDINTALRRYLSGNGDLTAVDKAIVDKALSLVGPPPNLTGEAVSSAPSVVGYFGKAGDAFGRIYRFLSDGTYEWVNADAWRHVRREDGSYPHVSMVSIDNPMWSQTQRGIDPYPESNPAATLTVQGYYRDIDTGAIYEFYTNGTKRYLGMMEWLRRKARAIDIEHNNPIWQRPSVGYDPYTKPASQAPGALTLKVGTVIPVPSNLTNVPLVASPNQ